MNLIIEPTVTVITPTIGSEYLEKAIESVQGQTYASIKHLLVYDGPEYYPWDHSGLKKHVERELQSVGIDNIQRVIAPENTGSLGFYGHRIYAAYPHLLNSDYICFLDEDNWYEPNHVETLVKKALESNAQFTYSLRNIVEQDGTFLTEDRCESIGKWPIFFTKDTLDEQYLIDTSSFCFRTDFIQQTCNHWHYGWGGDRRYLSVIKQIVEPLHYETTGLHTLNYRLDNNVEKKYGSKDFFNIGNEKVKAQYNGVYPWN